MNCVIKRKLDYILVCIYFTEWFGLVVSKQTNVIKIKNVLKYSFVSAHEGENLDNSNSWTFSNVLNILNLFLRVTVVKN